MLSKAEKQIKESIDCRLREIKELENDIERLRMEIGTIRNYCEHKQLKHHPRQIAESDPWDECLVCGAML